MRATGGYQQGQSRYLPNGVAGLIPPIDAVEFYGSSLLALLVVIFGLWLANAADPWLRPMFEGGQVQAWARSILLDPIVLHLGGYFSIAFVLFVIVRTRRWAPTAALAFAALLPLLGLVAVAMLMSLAIKPAMGYPRLLSFSPDVEPPLISLLHERIGHGLGFPSGNVVRQTILCAAVFTFLNHPDAKAALSKHAAAFLRWLNVLLVILVMIVRPLVGSHSLFDAAGGLAFGIMTFWAGLIPLSALLAGSGPVRFAAHFSSVWLAFAIVMFFYSMNPSQWALVALGFYGVLVGELLLLRMGTRQDAAAKSGG
jgi:hypothetical protein